MIVNNTGISIAPPNGQNREVLFNGRHVGYLYPLPTDPSAYWSFVIYEITTIGREFGDEQLAQEADRVRRRLIERIDISYRDLLRKYIACFDYILEAQTGNYAARIDFTPQELEELKRLSEEKI